MGTRSTYRVIDKYTYEGKVYEKKLVLMYVQMDGYPEGHPMDTAKWLSGGVVVNGISLAETRPLVFNGASCLAAQLVAKFKDGPGGTYLEPMNSRAKCGENYVYDIIVNEDKSITMKAFEVYKRPKLIFSGTPQEFVEWASKRN